MLPVYTYYEPLANTPELGDARLLELWAESWQRHGWAPQVLNRNLARQHPVYTKLLEVIKQYPHVNPDDYEAACFVRWLAFASVGTGLFVDYDILNLGYTPEQHQQWPEPSFWLDDHYWFPLQATGDLVVAMCATLLQGPPSNLQESAAVRWFGEQPHCSEFTLLRANFRWLPAKAVCRVAFSTPDWQHYRLVHLARWWVCYHAQLDRVQLAQQLLEKGNL